MIKKIILPSGRRDKREVSLPFLLKFHKTGNLIENGWRARQMEDDG
jgi:hypothetical protein